jgi:hypothetical protein
MDDEKMDHRTKEDGVPPLHPFGPPPPHGERDADNGVTPLRAFGSAHPLGGSDGEQLSTTAESAVAVEDRPEHVEPVAPPDAESHEDDRQHMEAPAVPLGPAATAERDVELMAPESRVEYRARWSDIQTGFVDDPTRAVRDADHLVADVMEHLAKTLAEERGHLEERWSQGNEDTEHLRVALQRYRHFFGLLLKE